MKSLIIGAGEVGKSLYKVLKNYHKIDIRDKKNQYLNKYEILHICFPYSKSFINYVKKYQNIYNPKYTIIHST
ncbi:MAG: hypothetical protein J7J61_07465, partial [Candidatus Hydrothermae bacterium]|nr:hypothetical protein [Candidatus Hydrothermae bacterium]